MKKFLSVTTLLCLTACSFGAFGGQEPSAPAAQKLGGDGHGIEQPLPKLVNDLRQVAKNPLWQDLKSKLEGVFGDARYAPLWTEVKGALENNQAGIQAGIETLLSNQISNKIIKPFGDLVHAFMLGEMYGKWKAKLKEVFDGAVSVMMLPPSAPEVSVPEQPALENSVSTQPVAPVPASAGLSQGKSTDQPKIGAAANASKPKSK